MPATTAPPKTNGSAPGRLGRFRSSRWWRWGRWPVYAGLGVLGLGLGFFLYLYATVALPADPPQLASSVILDRNGTEVAVLNQGELRVPVPLDKVAPTVPDALIAAEDRSFYDHPGINPAGIARAVLNNLRSDETQGGSTITQQLVKNEFLTSERTFTRKLRESILAVKLERRNDKREILERYLNTVYFGRGTYGIEAASRVYFDRSAADLTPNQAAFLVGLLPGPSAAEPSKFPAKALERRNAVIEDLAAVGKITPAEATARKAEPIDAAPGTHPVTLTGGVAPHFVDWVRQRLIERYGEPTVYGGGLRVTTTLDIEDQRAAEAAVRNALPDPAGPQAAMVGIDKTGAIRAYVGGRDATSQVDLARGTAGGGSGRQAGSTFKPFALAASLEKGTPLSRRRPAPARLSLTNPTWEVANYDGKAFGPLDEVEATAQSVNTVYAQMGVEVGAPAVADVATRAGITSELQANPSIVLGVDPVSVLDLAAAYLTFARDGSHVMPYPIAEVRDGSGELLASAPDPQRPALDPGVARAVNHALRAVVERGTGTGARLDRPMAGKTGTTDDYGDAWFAGYTPEYSAVVWMGHPEDRRTMTVGGRRVSGGSIPADIWKAFAGPALADVPPTDFAPPPANLLEGDQQPATLSVTSPVAPGATVEASGTGFENCVADFYVEVRATQTTDGRPGPAGLRSPGGAGTLEGARRASIPLPADAPEGQYLAVAQCDEGEGVRAAAEATFAVDDGRANPTTTTTASTTTTTAPPASTTVSGGRPGDGAPSTTTTVAATTSTRSRR